MDPNAALDEIRRVARILASQDELPIDDPARIGDFARLQHGDRLAALIEGLDQRVSPRRISAEGMGEVVMPSCTETVYVCLYTHKHGVDVGVYGSPEAALFAMHLLAKERAEDWDDEGDTAKFLSFEDKQEALDFFHEIEGDIMHGERLEVYERVVLNF